MNTSDGQVARRCASRAASRPPSAPGTPCRLRCRSACGTCRRSRRVDTSTTTTRSGSGASRQPRRSAVQRHAAHGEQQQRDPRRQVRHVRRDRDGECRQHPGQPADAATARSTQPRAVSRASNSASAFRQRSRWAGPTLVSMDVPGKPQRERLAALLRIEHPAAELLEPRLGGEARQAVAVEDVRDDVGAGVLLGVQALAARIGLPGHAPQRVARPGTAAGRQSPPRRSRPTARLRCPSR